MAVASMAARRTMATRAFDGAPPVVPGGSSQLARFSASYDSVMFFSVIATALGILNAMNFGWAQGWVGACARGTHHLGIALLRIGVERRRRLARLPQVMPMRLYRARCHPQQARYTGLLQC